MPEAASSAPAPRAQTPPGRERDLSMHGKAARDLAYIRRTMDGSARFTAVSGWGGVGTGAVAFAAAPFAAVRAGPAEWLVVWLAAALAAILVGGGAVALKARRTGQSLAAGAGRRFLFGLGPPLLLGALLTVALWEAGQVALMPPMWLLVYGTALTTAGSHSVGAVLAMGFAFLALGAAALEAGPAWGDHFMAVGFGGVHVAGGLAVLLKHGG